MAVLETVYSDIKHPLSIIFLCFNLVIFLKTHWNPKSVHRVPKGTLQFIAAEGACEKGSNFELRFPFREL